MVKFWIFLILVIVSIFGNIADDVSCHYKTEGDVLPSAEDASFSPPPNSIFFHETSCKTYLNSRTACAIESAAKAHPRKNVYVLFSSPITENNVHLNRSSILELYSFYPNIKFARVHIDEYTKNSALEKKFTNKTHHASPSTVVDTSSLLRFLTLFKFGGLYLDTDVIVVKPFDNMGMNWIAKDTPAHMNSAVVNIAKDRIGQEFARNVLEEISSLYKPDFSANVGPEAMYRVLANFCNETDAEKITKCRGFKVYDPERVYPVPVAKNLKFLVPGSLENIDKAFSLHLWNKESQGVCVHRDSPMDRLSTQYCPIIRQMYGDCFGY